MLKELPVPAKKINGFIIEDLNKFICEQTDNVLQFYTQLINVDIESSVVVPDLQHYQNKAVDYFSNEREMFEIVILRKKDLI